ncbi:dipeptidase [Pacificimonas sp. WHA3]|uniref:Dipeptidase n=1 Tax=Pacificimonas pallii TaxID=2827236 RepID=A0ABS6SCI7_9SPHN|nr:dipeptidase [Pacificimonas pallii]MBV7255631.1 dipeptidase [Pacificimonas pallii]
MARTPAKKGRPKPRAKPTSGTKPKAAAYGGLRRRFVFTAFIFIGIAALFFWAVPGIVERAMNRIEGSGLWRVSDDAAALHADLIVADMHADTLLWKRDPNRRTDRGHVDLQRLRDGNVALQVFGSVTKTPRGQNYDSNSADTDNITPLVIAQLQPPATWGSLLQRSLYHAQELRDAAEDEPAGFILVRTTADLAAVLKRRAAGEPVVGAMLGAEGLHNIEGDIANLDRLFAAGFRMGGITHFFDNELAGSMHGEVKGGLTPLGRQAVRRMERMGMLVDVAHLSHEALAELIDMAEKPLVSSHGGVQAVCDVNRNLTDEEIRGIAATGGVTGVGLWDGAVCQAAPAATARAMRHIRDLVGIEHVALGSDFDGAVTTGLDASGMAALTQALMDQGFSETEIRAAMGGNFIALLAKTLPRPVRPAE